ncbi:acyltransferase domain-containing protein, partial [Mycobacterium simiae]
VGGDCGELLAGLAALADGQHAAALAVGHPVGGKVAFVFPGHGPQWVSMAVELLDSSPVFAKELRACADALAPYVGWSLLEVLRGEVAESSLDRVDVVQPALFAVMVSLAALWRSCGVRPAMVVGHSQGEIAAAYVAGALSLEDAARLVALRGRVIAELARSGGMASVGLAVEQVESGLSRWQGRISVAAVNSPVSTTVSGELGVVEEFVAQCEADGVFARLIPVDYASHSVQVEAARERLIAELASITPRAGDVAFYSTVTGAGLSTEALDPEYWYRNLREPVRFADVTRLVLEQGCRTFIEMSPHPVLALAITETVEAAGQDLDEVAVLGSMRRGEGGWRRFVTSLAAAHVHGVGVDWASVFAPHHPQRVPLPTYAFQRERFWLKSYNATGSADLTSAGLSAVDHPLLSAAVSLGDDQGWLFSGQLSVSSQPWLADHAVFDVVLLPGTALVELALAAGARAGVPRLDELVLQTPLLVPDEGTVQLQLLIGGPDGDARRPVTVYSRPHSDASEPAHPWARHAAGVLSVDDGGDLQHLVSWPPAGAQAVDTQALYDRLSDKGFQYGPVFQGVQALWRRGEELFAEVGLGAEQPIEEFGVHPALFDAALHPAPSLIDGQPGQVLLPFAWSGVWLAGTGASRLRVALAPTDAGGLQLHAWDFNGDPVIRVDSLDVRPIDAAGLAGDNRGGVESLYALGWTPVETGQASAQQVAILDEGALNFTDIAAEHYPDLAGLAQAIRAGGSVPEVVLTAAPISDEGGVADSARSGLYRTLSLVQAWLGVPELTQSRLVFVTRL